MPARVLDSRSASVKDLRYGYTIDEEWTGKDPDAVFADVRRNIPLIDGAGYYVVAATISRNLSHSLCRLVLAHSAVGRVEPDSATEGGPPLSTLADIHPG